MRTNFVHFAVAVLMGVGLASPKAQGQTGAAKGEWLHYGGDAGGTKYSALDQINAANVSQLQIAWRWKNDNYGPRVDSNWQVTPLMAGGLLYFTAGSRRAAVAVPPATGETMWTNSPRAVELQ
jgi:quinoprotein glucose dehydrogenase